MIPTLYAWKSNSEPRPCVHDRVPSSDLFHLESNSHIAPSFPLLSTYLLAVEAGLDNGHTLIPTRLTV